MTLPDAGSTLTPREGVLLCSALVQWVADQAGIRILHVKGPAAEELLGFARTWSDVDVWVDPRRYKDLLKSLEGVGFSVPPVSPSVVWGHSVDLQPGRLGGARVDLHHRIPGMDRPAQGCFDRVWAERTHLNLAGRVCTTPNRVAHALLLGLHGARSPQGSPKWTEADTAWAALGEGELNKLIQLARAVGAEPTLGTRWAPFASHTSQGDRAYWAAVARGDTPAALVGRFRRAAKRPRLALLLAMTLGRDFAVRVRGAVGNIRRT